MPGCGVPGGEARSILRSPALEAAASPGLQLQPLHYYRLSSWHGSIVRPGGPGTYMHSDSAHPLHYNTYSYMATHFM